MEKNIYSVHTRNGQVEFLFLKDELVHNLLQGEFHNQE